MYNQIQRHEAQWYAACHMLAPIFSTCSKRQYFALIVAENKRLAGQGYNGSPPSMAHCIDGACPRAQHNSPSGSIYDNCIATHAEANAIMWTNPQTRQGSTLIINGTPCYGCAKLIATSGIRRIIGQSDETYAQQDHVHNYLLTNKIETILLTKTETRKIIDTYKNQPLLPNETRLREHTQSTTNTHPNTNPNNHPNNHHPIPRHTTTPNHPKI